MENNEQLGERLPRKLEHFGQQREEELRSSEDKLDNFEDVVSHNSEVSENSTEKCEGRLVTTTDLQAKQTQDISQK